jgi:PAS domain S-box-containing protein
MASLIARLTRGEGVAALCGVLVGAVVLSVLAASGWWTLRLHRESVRASREDQIRVVGRLLGSGAEGLLSDGELSALRRMVAQAAVEHDLSTLRVVLPDGSIIADSEASAITAATMPATWPRGPLSDATGTLETTQEGSLRLRTPLIVPGKGEAELVIAGNVVYPSWTDSTAQLGIAGIAAGGMLGLLLSYRVIRGRLRGLGAIRDALRAAAEGEACAGTLLIADRFGLEARAWNDLVREREQWRRRADVDATMGQAASTGVGGGEGSTALDALWQGVLVVDAEGAVRYANGAAAVVLKARREELSGAPLTRFCKDQDLLEAIDAVRLRKSGRRTSVELESRSEAGERTVLRASVRPLRREDSGSALVVIEDVTQQRIADESRNAFVAQATHELRTPLTNVRLYLDALLEEPDADARRRAECLNVVSQEARRLERLVADMLSVSEIEAGSLKLAVDDVRPGEVLEELHQDFKAQAEDKEITLAFELPPKLPTMQADRDKLTLTLHNLVGNALKYTPAGGKVTVAVSVDATNLQVDVTDNGIGIKPDEQELIFERFYRAKDGRIKGITGSGLGLALARQIARLHGGDITVRSQIDKGSTFTLAVPLGGPAATAVRSAKAA